MDERDEQVIRRALGRRPPPRPSRSLADAVLLRVARSRPTAGSSGGARRVLAASTWLLTGAACVAVLATLPWSGGTRVVAWAAALALVPVAYAAALWPGLLLALLATCAGVVVGERRGDAWREGGEPRRSA